MEASYPLPEGLSTRLLAGWKDNDERKRGIPVRDRRTVLSHTDALTHLVRNALEALDTLYFQTKRRHEHRLCLRIAATAETLSITDLGVGMTRADLINSLGVGRQIAKDKASSSESSVQTESTEEEEYGSMEEEDEDEDGEEDEEADEDGEDEPTNEDDEEVVTQQQPLRVDDIVLSCLDRDLGGFYSALCALATGVRVGTKSKFDDYYEAELGVCQADASEEQATELCSSFRIRRPLPEGAELWVETGFDQFHDIRGESGTRVTLHLNQQAMEAGLNDETVLKAIFLKIVETTNYTVAFSTDEGAQDIIDASAQEKAMLEELAEQPAEEDPLDGVADLNLETDETVGSHNSVKERAKYIPLRLSLGERKMLRLVEAAMTCCDYTTEVDRPFKNSVRRTHAQLKGVTAILRGLVTACDYSAGQKLLDSDNFGAYESFFRQMFEIARRHKIMNPEKMRTEYGKLVYLLQDAVSPTVRPHLGFSVKGPIESVYKFLEDRGGLDVLSDKFIEVATEEILAGKKTRATIDSEIRRKEKAVAHIKRKYQTSKLSSEDIHLCLYSICDNNSFLNSNRVPIDNVVDYLTTHFSPQEAEAGYSLSIVSGTDGARLSHSHERQYYFALQSLTLWRDIIDDMFRLWAMAEEDLLSESVTYSLQDTGQGMQRVQQSPRTYKAMQEILVRVQRKVSHWVGSTMIHLGDHNVPNSLSFIDKYTQVPRILGPIVSCLENVERIYEKDDGIKRMIDRGYGGLEKLRKDILYDFFRSAFDGSGADNFYDAGSCIDGRLTSAWNWCSQLPEKPFYPIFKLTGFIGFDGEFK